MLSLGDKLVSSHLYVLIEEVAAEHLLSVLGVEELGVEECVSTHGLGDEGEILIVEELVVVVQEEETHDGKVHDVLLEHWVINVEVGHIIIPLWIVWI